LDHFKWKERISKEEELLYLNQGKTTSQTDLFVDLISRSTNNIHFRLKVVRRLHFGEYHFGRTGKWIN
jgi:hypothetical protein